MVRMQPARTPHPAPTLALMHAALLLAGLGTLLLGPILPLLSARLQLDDTHAGLLLLAQFCGATLGGSTVSARLQRDLLLALVSAALGLAAFAFAPDLPFALAALLVAGFGIGRTLTSVNILAGARYTQHRGSALAWLNLSFSLGALLSPLAAASLAQRFPLTRLLLAFAALFLLSAAAFAAQLSSEPAASTSTGQAAPPSASPLPGQVFLLFAALIFLYGGLETALAAWLTTFALRETLTTLRFSQLITVLLLAGLTAGRALTGLLLRRLPETILQRAGLLLAAFFAATLALAHHASTLAGAAILLGVCLAPIFPATFALLMAHRPTPSQAGLVLAASGLGAAGFPALMGIVSTHTGSLRTALIVPVLLALAMLALTALQPALKSPTSV